VNYHFTPPELCYLITCAESRTAFKAGARTKSRKVDKNSNEFSTTMKGMMGEHAVSRLLGVTADMTNLIGGDGGADLIINDRSIQIKTTTMRTPDLIVFKDDRRLKSDIAVLVVLESIVCVRIAGWISRQEFYEMCYSKDYKYGTRDVVSGSSLRPFEDLISRCQTHLNSQARDARTALLSRQKRVQEAAAMSA
jgi:hypothetical protein